MSAIQYLSSLKSFIQKAEFNSESAIFRLHYQFTAVVLLASSVLLTASEFFGDPINCIAGPDVPRHVIETYCWISSTFTLLDYLPRELGEQAIHPGVFSPEAYDDDTMREKWRFHNYYQWVVFFLFFMAGACYFPKFIWDLSEGGLMEAIGKGLKKGLHKEEDICGRKKSVVDYVVTHIRMHNSYVFKYWFCEFLCLFNIIGQMFLIDKFLGNEFLKYGTKVLEFSDQDQDERVDPMIFVFPRMTKCHFHKFGPSGTVERTDALCILPLNILNEKTFIFIWFWYVILATLLSGLVLYRFLLLTLPGLRPKIMHQHNKIVPIEALQVFTNKTSIGDWWIMYVLSKNLDPMIYRDIMTRLAKEIETGASNNAYNAPKSRDAHVSSAV